MNCQEEESADANRKTRYLKTANRDFPGGPVVKKPPYNAGDEGLIPDQETKILHAMGQLSPRHSY